MHIRFLEPRDISAAIDIATAAFLNDELFRFLAPKRHVYPTSWRKWMAARLRARLVERGTWGFVAVPSAAPADRDTVLGYAFWERSVGPESAPSLAIVAAAASIWPIELTVDEEVRARRDALAYDPWSNNNDDWWAAVNRLLLQVEARFDRLLRANAAGDYAALGTFESPAGDNEAVLGPLYAGITHWHLAVLAVDPAHQRQGVGSGLVRWGLKLAEQESREKGFSIPVSLIASAQGLSLYRNLGFKIVDWVGLDVGPTDGPAGAAMVWDGRSTWVQKAPEGTLSKAGHPVDVVWSKRASDKLKWNDL